MMRTFDDLRFASKLGVVIVLSSGMALCILCAAFLAYDLRGSRLSLELHLSTLAAVVGENSSAALEFRDPSAASEVLSALHSEPSLVAACLYDKTGRLFASYQRSQAFQDQQCPSSVPEKSRNDALFIGIMRPASWNAEPVGTVYLQSDLIEMKDRWERLIRVAMGLLIGSLLVGSIAGWVLIRRISGRISELAHTMRIVSIKKDFGVRVSRTGNDEVGQLSAGFNEMLAEIEFRDAELERNRHSLEDELKERVRMNEELRTYREHLEVLVQSRTNALESKEEQLRLLLESTAEGIMGIDLEGKNTFCNPAWLRMFGYQSAEDVVGNDMHELIHHHTREGERIHPEICRLRQVLLTGEGTHSDNEVLWRADGTCFPAEYWSHPQVIGGRIVGAVIAMVDITERKLMEDELRHAKDAAEAASRAKSMFLANMSHEIRTPMNGILGFSQLMLGDPLLSVQQRSHLDTINRCGEHLLSLITDILEMSKIEAGRTTTTLAAFDLHALIDDLEAMFRMRADAKKLQFIVERLGRLPRNIISDVSKLRQVFINLLGNAIKFTSNGGVVLRVRVQQDISGLRLEAEVEDTGVGIPAHEVGGMFRYFEQTQSGRMSGTGTGLGLAISREFARLLGGDITVRSEVGFGSLFSLKVLVQPANELETFASGRATRRVKRLKLDQPKFRVLIADDKEVNRNLLADLLAPIGFELRDATNGLEAIRSYEEWHPHLILMDVIMPIMDGNEAVCDIRQRCHDRSVKIITVSASSFEEDRKRALDIGANDFISKPFRQSELLEKIKILLGAEYTYEDEVTSSVPTGMDSVHSSLAKLPPELLASIASSARVGEFDRVAELISEVALIAPSIAETLGRLSEQFDSDNLLRLIQPHPHEEHDAI